MIKKTGLTHDNQKTLTNLSITPTLDYSTFNFEYIIKLFNQGSLSRGDISNYELQGINVVFGADGKISRMGVK